MLFLDNRAIVLEVGIPYCSRVVDYFWKFPSNILSYMKNNETIGASFYLWISSETFQINTLSRNKITGA